MTPILTNLNTCIFSVWAPEKKKMMLQLEETGGTAITLEMNKTAGGYFTLEVPAVRTGRRYWYKPNGKRKYPDPASAFQPEGVHGPSEIVDHRSYVWQDQSWRGIPLAESIVYELHVGTFTPEGSFEAIIPRLADLADLGINVIELMPVNQCPGKRNWGYDGTSLFAVQHTYGGPTGLKKLVDAAHRQGIAVWLDVVYNHLGQEGAYLPQFGPYFSDKYHTPWGKAFNFDDAGSDGVRAFVLQNVLYWAEHYHIDGLRLDAIHEIFDRNATSIWDCLYDTVRNWEASSGRRLLITAESDLNSPRVVREPALGGYGLDAQWMDDFHHCLYTLLDKAGRSHYQDFGSIQQMAKAYTEGFVHSGEYMHFRQRTHGASSAGLPGQRFIVFNQNHDLPGNRPDGKRLAALVEPAKLKLAAAAVLLSPYIPLLFMGEEYAEDQPFFFFSDYSEPAVIDAQRQGRKQQFAGFGWNEEAPDAQDTTTFLHSILQWEKRKEIFHKEILDWHRQLIHLRRTHPLLSNLSKKYFRVDTIEPGGLALHRHDSSGNHQLTCLFNFSDQPLGYPLDNWTPLLHSATPIQNILPPWSASVYEKML